MSETNVNTEPNILITGTPGVGKSYLCSRLSEQLNLKWWECSQLAVKEGLTAGYDDDLWCPILDEDRLIDYLEPMMQKGGNIVEYHGCDFFPERWFQAVYVVRCSTTTVLFDRLKKRRYNGVKVKTNMACEIFGTIREEAKNSYKPEIVFELSGETENDAENNLETIKQWYKDWKSK